jgi:hypothetical protein
MAGNTVTLTIAGDSRALQNATGQAGSALQQLADDATSASNDMEQAGASGADLSAKLGHLGGAVSGATDALDTIGGSLQAVNDLQNAGANRAAAMRRALIAVEQAQEDYNQALRDGAQAALDTGQAEIDLEQANLDASIALKEYNKAVKEHGVNSVEARQAGLDLKQAQQDVKQATEDGNQAQRDAAAALINAKTAQEDLNDANKEAHPPELQKWADNLTLVTPLLSAVVGIVGLVTAAQWLWNSALFASPITWIIVGIVALVAIIVLIAVKTTWFQDIWTATWSWIKDSAAVVGVWFRDELWGVYIKGTFEGIVAGVLWVKDLVVMTFVGIKDGALAAWGWITGLPELLRTAFSRVTSFITAPFRTAFNFVSDAWNNTVGRLSWTVPGWVPGIGGNSIGAPKLPKFHQGGTAPGSMGSEFLAILQAGETVSRAGGSGSFDNLHVTVELVGDGVLRVVRAEVGKRGSVERALGSDHG